MFHKLTNRQWSIIFLIILFLLFLYFILPVSIPLIIALFTALALNPVVRFFQHKGKLNRKYAVIIVFLLFIIIIGFVGTFVITKTITQVVHFVEEVPEYFNQINTIYKDLEADFRHYTQNLPEEFVRQVSNSLEENLTALNNTVKEKITLDNIAQIFAMIPQYLISFLVYLIALFLFMLELPLLKSKMYHLFTKDTAEKFSFMNRRLADVLIGFLKAQFLLSIIIFVVTLTGLFLIAPDIAFMMAFIIWLIDLIPIIGSIIILGPWSLFMFLSGEIAIGIKLAILAIILLAIRRILEPKMMGQHIGLSPLTTLVAMFLGLKLLGIWGFVLGPLLVITFNSAKEAGIIRWKLKI